MKKEFYRNLLLNVFKANKLNFTKILLLISLKTVRKFYFSKSLFFNPKTGSHMFVCKKLYALAIAAAVSGAFASAGYSAESTSFLGRSSGDIDWYTGFNYYDWTNGNPYNDDKQDMDVTFSTETEGFQGKGTLSTWCEVNRDRNGIRRFNSITIQGQALSWRGISLGGLFADDKDTATRYSTIKVANDITINDCSSMITGGGVHKGTWSVFEGKYGTVHSYLDVGGNFSFGENATKWATFRLGGESGYLNGSSEREYAPDKSPLDQVTIGKDLILGGGGTINMNVGINAYGTTYDINNPDIYIGGRIVGYGGTDSDGIVRNGGVSGGTECWIDISSITKSDASTATGRTTVLSVNGISGKVCIKNGAVRFSEKGAKYLTVLHLRNDGYAEGYHLADDTGGSNWGWHCFTDSSKIKVVMDGEGEQRFSKGFFISGGIEVNQGTLLLKSNISGADGKNLSGTGDTKQYNHGVLEMNDGTFGFYLGSSGGEFRLDSIVWAGGTLQLCVYKNSVDSFFVENGFSLYDAFVGDVVFRFVGEGDDISYLTTDQIRIIRWTDGNYDKNAVFTADDKIIDGNLYKAQFTAKDDGLYVKYVSSIPEPATCALLFGVFALCLAVWRGRK